MSKIEWTGATWNPIVGCSLASTGCTNCSAMSVAHRLGHNPATPHYAGTTRRVNGNTVWTGRLAMAPEHVLTAPLRRMKPTTYFVKSMGDLFHEDVPDDWIDQVFAVMALCPQHTFQVLTKRSARMRIYCKMLRARARQIAQAIPGHYFEPWSRLQHAPLPNVWLGVSVEDQRRADDRIPDLLATPATIRFISAEPLLGPVDLTSIARTGGELGFMRPLDGRFNTLDWVITGGESGPGARPMHPDWARSLRDQCVAAEVPFFFKQWGKYLPLDQKVATDYGTQDADDEFDVGDAEERDILHTWPDGNASIPLRKSAAGRLLDGREWNEVPETSP